jgi:hypothetical protein
VTNDEAHLLIDQIERNMNPMDVQRIIEGDPDAPKPRGVLDMRHLHGGKTLKKAGLCAPYAFRKAPIWTGAKR